MSAHADTAREPVPAPTRLVTHLLRPEARRDAVVAVVAATLLALWDLSGADLQVVRWFGHSDGFAWRDAWLTSTVLHEGGRLLAWGLFAGLVLNVWRPLIAGPSASERIRALVATTISLLSVSALKRVSHTSCPWDLAEFGGTARYVSHWSFGVLDGGAGAYVTVALAAAREFAQPGKQLYFHAHARPIAISRAASSAGSAVAPSTQASPS